MTALRTLALALGSVAVTTFATVANALGVALLSHGFSAITQPT